MLGFHRALARILTELIKLSSAGQNGDASPGGLRNSIQMTPKQTEELRKAQRTMVRTTERKLKKNHHTNVERFMRM